MFATLSALIGWQRRYCRTMTTAAAVVLVAAFAAVAALAGLVAVRLYRGDG